MTLTLTESSSDILADRWHDQSLDIESIKFDGTHGTCVFSVCETDERRKTSLCAIGKLGLFKTPVQRCLVSVRNVIGVELRNAEGEAELYVEDIQATPSRLCFQCMNGIFEIKGHDLEISLECAPLTGDEQAEELTLSLLVIEISWCKRLKQHARVSRPAKMGRR